MPESSVRHKLRSELETPLDERRLGSGWLSGTLAFLLSAGCLIARHAIVNRSQRQQTPCLIGVPRAASQPTQLRRAKVRPQNNRRAHRYPPESNHRKAIESQPARPSKSLGYRILV